MYCALSTRRLAEAFSAQTWHNCFDNSCAHPGGSRIRVIISFACSVGSAGAGEQRRVSFHQRARVSLRLVAKDSPVCYLASIELTCVFSASQQHEDSMAGGCQKLPLFFTSNDRVSTTSMTSDTIVHETAMSSVLAQQASFFPPILGPTPLDRYRCHKTVASVVVRMDSK